MKFMEIELEKIKATGILPDYVTIGKPPAASDTPETDEKWNSLLWSGTPWKWIAEQMLEACADMESERNDLKTAGVEIIEAARRSLPRPHLTIERNAGIFFPENAKLRDAGESGGEQH